MGKKLGDLLKEWHKRIDDRAEEFRLHAQSVRRWDAQLLENERKITELTNTINTLQHDRKRINSQMERVRLEQDKQERELDDLDTKIQELVEPGAGSSDVHREHAYSSATELLRQLESMEQKLQSITGALNDSQKAAMDGEQSMLQVLVVLNNHQRAMEGVHGRARAVRDGVRQLQAHFADHVA